MTLDRLELLAIEENAQIKAAKDVGANTAQIEQYYSLRREEIQDERRKAQSEKDAQLVIEKETLERQWTDAVFYQSATRSQIIEQEYTHALEEADKLGADKTAIEKYYSDLRQGLVKEEAQAQKHFLISAIEEWGSMVGDVLSKIGGLFSQSNSNRMAEIDNWLQSQLNANEMSTLNEEEQLARKAELEEMADQKKRALQLKNAKREKAFAIFGAIINTAQGVASALKAGFPLGAIMAGVYGAIGLAQVGLISAQPLPQLDVGGRINQDVVAQLHQNEAVIPLKKEVYTEIGQGITRAGGGSAIGGGRENHTHLHIGTLIADERGLKDLDKRLRKFRVAEDQRRGEA